MTIERRTLAVDGLEVRAEGESQKIVGHAAVFNRLSDPIRGRFKERISPGAFARAISEQQDVRALVNHDPSLVLGRTKAGTLRMSEDSTGLLVEIDPPDTSYSRDLMESIRRGDIDQMSFGFTVVEETWTRGKDGDLDIRELRDVDLFDVSPVTYPAYPDTDVAVRSHERWRESEAHLNDERRTRLMRSLLD